MVAVVAVVTASGAVGAWGWGDLIVSPYGLAAAVLLAIAYVVR